MKHTVPAFAERHDLLPLMTAERTASQFAPGAFQLKPKLICPACKVQQDSPAVFETVECECGLSMQIGAGVLHVWRKPVFQMAAG